MRCMVSVEDLTVCGMSSLLCLRLEFLVLGFGSFANEIFVVKNCFCTVDLRGHISLISLIMMSRG